MKRFLILMAALILSMPAIYAQGNQQLPVNPKVKHGILPNGLSYYIMHNEQPKERANFYIAQKVGSTLEDPDQLGLAHFLEHMAFNGTTHYPGKDMLNYLQSKGIRFGADINAYTSFDETVYNINNVPTTDKPLIDSVLLVLHDWSGDILLEESEIDAERGVIQEEWRSRNNAQIRMYTEILPKIYKEYQYQQMPIGKMDVVMNFKPEVLRAYYKKWYRPDQQGIIIVGDFDADEMEQKVIELFSTIIMPENAAPRTYPEVSNNIEPIFVSYSDPELTNMMTTISFKSDKTPFDQRNTVQAYLEDTILKQLIGMMINIRLSENALNPDCNYSYSGVYFGNFYFSKTKDSFNIRVIAKNNSEKAVADAMAVVSRACKTGFNETEYDRAKQELIAGLEKQLAEVNKTNNASYGDELCRLFIDNEPAPGIEAEYQIWNMTLPMIPVEAINMAVAELLTIENMVVVTSAPKADGFELATESGMLSGIDTAMKAEYAALEEEKINEPLITYMPKKGSIISSSINEKFGTTEWTLSNGAKVILKPTDFAGDEILMTAYREGGKQIYDKSQAANVLMMEDVFESSKMGPFDTKTLRKYLAGKNVNLGFSVNTYTDMLKGYSTVKDLPYLFELIYTAFTNINPDEDTYKVNIDRARPMLANSEKNPQTIFFNQITSTRYDNNPLMLNPTVATLDEADYMQALGLVKAVLSNAGQFIFIFTGNIDIDSFKNYVEQYIATLPAIGEAHNTIKTPISISQGQIVNDFQQPMETPLTMVYDIYSGTNVPYTMKNKLMVELVGDILSNIFTDTLREEEGGTYSPQAGSQFTINNNTWDLSYIFFTNADMQDKLIKRADEELMKLLQNGADETNFNKAKQAKIKQYEIQSRKNGYWDGALMNQSRFPNDQIIEGYSETLNDITLSDFNTFIKNLYDGKNRIQVIMEGVEAK